MAMVEGGKSHIIDWDDSSDIFDDTKSSLPELLGFSKDFGKLMRRLVVPSILWRKAFEFSLL